MQIRHFLLLLVTYPCFAAIPPAKRPPPFQIYAGYSMLSNSFNGVAGARQPLNGWDAGVAFRQWHRLRVKLDYSMYRGNNRGDPQHAFFIMAGGEYGANFHREFFYAEALAGEGSLNGTWFSTANSGYKNGNTGTIASFAEFLGGGIDTRISRHSAFRIEGGIQHSNFDPITSDIEGSLPYRLRSIPDSFGRVSAGMVWIPRLGSAIRPPSEQVSHSPVESELVFESLNSVGHIHLFSDSWWSYLNIGGIEYDRHSWGRFLGADVDYSAEFLPIVILRQPSKTTFWGNRLATSLETIHGIGILPLGARLIWFDGARVKPYYSIKAGMTAYSQKVFSQDSTYQDFALDQIIGVQFRLSGRIGFRSGVGFFHQSNGFIVPSNPGLDEMDWNTGLSYHLGRFRPAH